MLSFIDINVRYGDVHVLKSVSGTLKPSRFTSLIGPNGTGKSSLLKAIAGLVPTVGAVKLGDGLPLTVQERSSTIAYMQQDVGPTSSLTVLEVVLLGRLDRLGLRVSRELYEEALSILADFGVDTLAERTLAEISGGQRQLVYVAQSLFRKPKVLLLDEPTAALDLKHQLVVLNALKTYAAQHSVMIMAAMHDLTLCARFADTIICLSDGKVKNCGTPRDILTQNLIEEVYGVTARVSHNEDGHLAVVPIAAIDSKIVG